MRRRFRLRRAIVAILVLGTVAICLLFAKEARQPESKAASASELRWPTGYPQLVSVEPLPTDDGEMCAWAPGGAHTTLAALQQERMVTPSAAKAAAVPAADVGAQIKMNRAAVRVIRGPYPLYTGVSVDPVRGEIVATDENFLNLVVYDRLANTPSDAAFTEPKRVIGGSREEPQDSTIQFPCGVYVDPKNGDTYVVSNDLSQAVQVFPHEAKGNVEPARKFRIPVETFGLAVDNQNEEVFVTVEHFPAVLVFNKWADGYDAPLRVLDGRDTGLADPHGIAIDSKNDLMFVANHGSVSDPTGPEGRHYGLYENFIQGNGVPGWLVPWTDDLTEHRRLVVPGSGRFVPTSIAVYPRKASGNMQPMRVIQGPKTQLDWPGHLFMDQEHGELFVANDMGDSILVFHATDSGDVAPFRVLKGLKTGLKRPSGVFVDTKNNELVVANMRTSSITVYARDATGDTAPLRTIRGAPVGESAPMILKPSGVAYDSKREEYLVPN